MIKDIETGKYVFIHKENDELHERDSCLIGKCSILYNSRVDSISNNGMFRLFVGNWFKRLVTRIRSSNANLKCEYTTPLNRQTQLTLRNGWLNQFHATWFPSDWMKSTTLTYTNIFRILFTFGWALLCIASHHEGNNIGTNKKLDYERHVLIAGKFGNAKWIDDPEHQIACQRVNVSIYFRDEYVVLTIMFYIILHLDFIESSIIKQNRSTRLGSLYSLWSSY